MLAATKASAAPLDDTSATDIAKSGVASVHISGGTVWSDKDGPFTLEDLVKKCAPVLWFSHDEPLFKLFNNSIRAPQPIFGDLRNSGNVVYYYGIKRLKLAYDLDLKGVDLLVYE
jgi:hypothetical protein